MLEDELLEIAMEGAIAAGSILLDHYERTATGVGTKTSATDPVSDADRRSEEFLTNHIEQARPDDGILGEEGAGKPSSSGLTWVIDPLDGTVNYLYRIPVWGVSVAVEDDDGAVVGVVYEPSRSEMFAAIKGRGARLNGSPIAASTRTELSTALVATGFSYDRSIRSHQADVVARVLPEVRDIRRLGSAALDLCGVACGRVDGFFEAYLERWDRAAGVLIAREAGCVVTDLSPPSGEATGVIASGPGIHEDLCRLIDR